jgi:uncharacterized metal-binding protein YceD (DUF177 family)
MDRNDDNSDELCRPIAIAEIGTEAMRLEIEASDAERAAVAHRLGLVGLGQFTAQIAVSRSSRDDIRVWGKIFAELNQECVVTFEPVADQIEDTFELRLIEGGAWRDGDQVADETDEEQPEPIGGPLLDLGEIAVQQLSLALNPYPRAPGVEYQRVERGDAIPEDGFNGPGRVSPFAALAELKDKLKG